LCGAPARNDFAAPVTPRLEQLHGWIDHLRELGVNALYLGPVFESSAHGYDTADYYRVDRRLGDNQTLTQLIDALHCRGIRVILDGVFNHVGRDFWAFRDVQERRERSAYRDWFQGLTFDRTSPYHDPFAYEGWNGHYDLVKLNLHNSEVKQHLFQAIEMWVRDFHIDGLRLDVADCLDFGFLRELGTFCRSRRADFWLMGEVVHGDYRRWANADTIDSVTNYECYKGLYSSLLDKNYFEIAYALNRQFGADGLYREVPLYNFADNHDVDRVASQLIDPAQLYPLYGLLFTMPGVPSIYYGSEWGLEGKRANGSDAPLRPPLDRSTLPQTVAQRDLANAIARLARLRQNSPALRYGDYHQLYVNHQQFAFTRQTTDECLLVLLNASDQPAPFELNLPFAGAHQLVDVLNGGEAFQVAGGKARIDPVWPQWVRVLRVTSA
jgi:cyclomaltodextrinase / maltogenic alpha-amylase / neopullulanase